MRPCPTLVLSVGLVALFLTPALAVIDVWIDPGHGGQDPGALGINGDSLPNEKEFNIGVCNFLEGYIFGDVGRDR